MNAKQIEKSILGANLSVEHLGDNSLRFVREYSGGPFAQYFVDTTNSLPVKTSLYKYQEELLGDAYFDNPALQWSSYLYFILDPEVREALGHEAVAEVEADRNFARKYVLTPREFEESLAGRELETPDVVASGESIEETWRRILDKPGFAEAVFTTPGTSAKHRLELILSGAQSKKSSTKNRAAGATAIDSSNSDELIQFVRELQTKNFRPKIDDRLFEIADVTLVHGPNGAGKTSVLEGIEYFFCGATRRDPDFDGRGTRVTATLADGKPRTTKSGTPKKVFKARNLEWYGGRDLSSSTLQDSFARSNFLNVDAAAALEFMEDADEDMRDALANLVVGPSAAMHWTEIQRLHRAIPSRLRAAAAETRECESEVRHQRERRNAFLAANRKSAAARVAARAGLDRLGWALDDEANADDVEELQGELDHLNAILEIPAELGFLPKPVSLNSIEREIRSFEKSKSTLVKAQARYDRAVDESDGLNQKLADLEEWDSVIERANEYLESEFEKVLVERDSRHARVSSLERIASVTVPKFDAHESLLKLTSVKALKLSNDEVKRLNAELVAASRARDQAVLTADELKQLTSSLIAAAGQIREHRHTPAGSNEPCPLCGTAYPPGELTTRIAKSADAAGSAAASAAITRVASAESALREATAVNEFLSQLAGLDEVSASESVATGITTVRDAGVNLGPARKAAEVSDAQFRQLIRQGMSESDLSDLIADLREFANEDSNASLPKLASRAATVQRSTRRSLEHKLATQGSRLTKAMEEMRVAVGARGRTEESISLAESQLETRLESAQEYLESAISESALEPPRDLAIAEVRRSLRSDSTLLSRLSAQLRIEEELAGASESEIADLAERLKTKSAELATWKLAEETFNEIVEKHSREEATREEMASNRAAIEWIFRRIHAPAEFAGLDAELFTSLTRIDGSPAQLSQISTGQRAALALSIFLAFNRRSVGAPPVILIDDPIAHVDDLNTLAFLDYLRDLALEGERQIVFATASSKLAGLFRRKFEFLRADGRFTEIPLET